MSLAMTCRTYCCLKQFLTLRLDRGGQEVKIFVLSYIIYIGVLSVFPPFYPFISRII